MLRNNIPLLLHGNLSGKNRPYNRGWMGYFCYNPRMDTLGFMGSKRAGEGRESRKTIVPASSEYAYPGSTAAGSETTVQFFRARATQQKLQDSNKSG